MTKQVLISYASADQEVALQICDYLEDTGISCWIAPRDIVPGMDWSGAIVSGLEEVEIVILVYSAAADNSKHVPREIERSDSKGKILIPFTLEDIASESSLSYYLGATQGIEAYPSAVEKYFPKLLDAVRTHQKTQYQSPATSPVGKDAKVEDADLVALARAICWNIYEELRVSTRSEEVGITLSEPKHGQVVKFIDVLCNKHARETIGRWSKRHQCDVLLVGEDLAPLIPSPARTPIICCLDSLDGTQHWLRSRNLYCTALSLFQRGPKKNDPYRLRVSAVQNAEGTIFLAREDSQTTLVGDDPSAVMVPGTSIESLAKAQVCTVARRPAHYTLLMEQLKNGSPFQGLYTFGGNPILCDLILGRYDAIFQPDASSINDNQEIWDWLPGGHVVYRAGGCILDLDGNPLNVVEAAERCLEGEKVNVPYVATSNRQLGEKIVHWLTMDK